MDEAMLRRLDGALDEVLRRLRVRLRRAMHQSGGDHPGGGGGMRILAQLVREGPSSPSELADGLEVRTSTMAAHLDRLEAAGYVQRVPRGAGGSRTEVRITDAGVEAHRRHLELRQKILSEMMAPLAPADTERLTELLARVARGESDRPLEMEG